MEKRQLGKSSLRIAPLVFGGNVFGWTVDETKAFQLLDSFIGAGFDMVDTANSYSHWVPGNKGGESETMIGNWIKKRANRSKVIIATKVGSDVGQGHRDISKKHILTAVEDSLRRLQTDYIDLYQTHWDVEATPVDETLSAHAQLVKEGKVRWIGASNFIPERLKESLDASKRDGIPRYESIQPLYNLYEREPFEKELEKICADANLGVITYYSLARGFLSGKYRTETDLRGHARGSGIKMYLDDRGFRILAALDRVSKDYHTTPASVAIAWLIARPSVTAPIASATSVEQLNALIKATELKLDNTSLSALDKASKW